MQDHKKKVILSAALAGILGAGVALAQAAPALAADTKAETGKCMSANACKGKSSCASAKNACAGQNGCKGQGFVKTTEAQCKKLKKKFKNAKFEKAES